MEVRINNISKTFDHKTKVLENLSINIASGSLTTLLGLSGCGKTTLLRIIAGLENSDTGSISLGNKVVFDAEKQISEAPIKRNIGFVFQDFALWPNMTALENVEFGLDNRIPSLSFKDLTTSFFKKSKERKEKIRAKAIECLKMVRMESFANRLPNELSGGQKQRVAIARAIAIDPSLILFDEPLSALDAVLREEMRSEIRNLVKSLHMTAIFVTHDQEEAMSISDSIIVMNKGKIVEQGSPEEIYWHPKSKFVSKFIGKASFLDDNHFLRPEDISLRSSIRKRNETVTIKHVQCKGGNYFIEASNEKGNLFYFYESKPIEVASRLSIYFDETNIREVHE